MKVGEEGLNGEDQVCLGGQCIDLGTDVRFAQPIDNCIYSIWYNIAACIHPCPVPFTLAPFITGVFLRNCIIPISIFHPSVPS